jgi:hypothetical protein
MIILVAVGLAAGLALTALSFHDLQVRLERWDYRRHADD